MLWFLQNTKGSGGGVVVLWCRWKKMEVREEEEEGRGEGRRKKKAWNNWGCRD